MTSSREIGGITVLFVQSQGIRNSTAAADNADRRSPKPPRGFKMRLTSLLSAMTLQPSGVTSKASFNIVALACAISNYRRHGVSVPRGIRSLPIVPI